MDINQTNQTAEMLQQETPFIHFPTIPLCKDITDKSIYNTIYCYILLALYFAVIFTFLTWQIRWVYQWWQQRNQRNGLLEFGSNRRDIEQQQHNKKIFSGLVSKRQNTE